jgi:peptidyl-tRNA hydrolase
MEDPVEDPIVMYLIVRESLSMSIGKTAAQTAHASQYLIVSYFDMKAQYDGCLTCAWQPPLKHKEYLDIMKAWLPGSRKVVLKADDKEWEKIKVAFPDCALVVDAGLTELVGQNETVIGLWPMKKSEVPKLIKRLQVLK